MKNPILIYGAGSLAREILATISFINNSNTVKKIEVKGLIVDPEYYETLSIMNTPVYLYNQLNDEDFLNNSFIIGMGEPRDVSRVKERLLNRGVNSWATIINPTSYIAEDIQIAEGVFVAANASISTGSIIGENVIINQNCSIGHDVTIEDCSVISPGCVISGGVNISKSVFFGSGAVALPRICVGKGSIVAANVVIHKNVGPNMKVLSVTRNIEIPTEQIDGNN